MQITSRRPVVARARRNARSLASEPVETRKHAFQRIRQQRGQPLGEAHHAPVQEARVGVEQPQLADGRRGHARMAVADRRDVVDAVQVGAAVRVVEVLAQAAHDLGRLDVVERLGVRDHGPPACEQVGAFVLCGRQSEQWRRVGAERRARRPRDLVRRGPAARGATGWRPGRAGAAAARRPRRDARAARLRRRCRPCVTVGARPASRSARPSAASTRSRSPDALDAARERRAHVAARLCEEVEAEVDRGRLGVRELARRVQARLAVGTDGPGCRQGRQGAGASARRRRRARRSRARGRRRRPGAKSGSGQAVAVGTRGVSAAARRPQASRKAASASVRSIFADGLADRPVARARALRVLVLGLEQACCSVPTARIAARAAIRWGSASSSASSSGQASSNPRTISATAPMGSSGS